MTCPFACVAYCVLCRDEVYAVCSTQVIVTNWLTYLSTIPYYQLQTQESLCLSEAPFLLKFQPMS